MKETYVGAELHEFYLYRALPFTNGYTNIYILKHGFEAWNGKVKKREN